MSQVNYGHKLHSSNFMKEEGSSAGTFFPQCWKLIELLDLPKLPSSGLALQRYCNNIFLKEIHS